jgi:hypothetical protein
MSRIKYNPPAATSTGIILTVTGQIIAAELTAPGSQTPTFTTPAGPNGRQWLFIYYNIDNVNAAWNTIALFLDGDNSTFFDRTALITSTIGGNSVNYTAAHDVNNVTRGDIVFNWSGNAALVVGALTYSIIYRNI